MMAEIVAEAKRRAEFIARNQRRKYQPRGYAADIQHLTNPEIVLSGPAGTGKSRAWLEKLHRLCLEYPGLRALIVRKTRASLSQSALYTFETHVLGPGHPLSENVRREYRQSYLYPNGSELAVGGLDKSTRIMSTEWDIIFVQEAIELSLDEWESLTTRLRSGVLPYQQIGADANPDRPDHWLNKRSDGGATRMLHTKHEDNPRLWDAERGEWTAEGVAYIAKLDALSGVRKERLRHGRWVQAEGAVYDFDEKTHVVDWFEPPAEWRRIRAIDFGYTNPFVCQWWAIDGDGRMYLYRELYRTKRLVEEHAAEILKLSEGESIEATVADWDAEGRATLSEHGVPTSPAKKEIRVGIETVQARLKAQGDGKPRLFVMQNTVQDRDDALEEMHKPISTKQEFGGYAYPKSADGKPNKEVPVDLDNHGMDAMRYAVMYLDKHTVLQESDNPFFG